MDYITIVAPTFEEAVAIAKKKYGNRVRIHSRKDIRKSGFFGLGRSAECELTCFLTEAEESDINNGFDLASTSTEKNAVQQSQVTEEEILRFAQEAKTPDPEITLSKKFNVASPAVFELAKKNILEADSENKLEKEFDKKEFDNKQVKDNIVVSENDKKIEELLQLARHLLVVNDFTGKYIDWLLSSIKEILISALPQIPTNEELEIMVLDKIAESFSVDTAFCQNPDRIVVILGPASAGKTSMVAKLVAAFSSISCSVRRNVRVVLLDDTPAVVAQFQKLGKALNIGVSIAPHEAEMTDALNPQFNNELIFVDAVGKPIQNNNPDYRLFGLMNVAKREESKYLMTIPASMKNSDIEKVFEQYKTYPVSGILVTKLDETTTVGNVISLCYEHNLPILYISNGRKIPKDICKATSSAFLRLLQGFSIDINEIIESEQ